MTAERDCFIPVTEHLIKGLVTARYGCLLLVTTLANNPSLVEQGALFLAQVLKTQGETSNARPNSPIIQDSGPAAATGPAKDSGGLVLILKYKFASSDESSTLVL